jgi:hypothetical protein
MKTRLSHRTREQMAANAVSGGGSRVVEALGWLLQAQACNMLKAGSASSASRTQCHKTSAEYFHGEKVALDYAALLCLVHTACNTLLRKGPRR